MNHIKEPEVYDPPTSPGKDYILKISVKNGPLLRAIRMRGYKSIARFAAACGIHPVHIYEYVSLRCAPLSKKGEWKKSVLKMAEVLRLPPDSLFPEQHLENVLKRTSGELEVSSSELQYLISNNEIVGPEQQLERKQAQSKLIELLSDKLSAQEERVLRLRFGLDGDEEKTLAEVGSILTISAQRVKQIEQQAMRRLKAIPTLKQLSNCGGYDFVNLKK